MGIVFGITGTKEPAYIVIKNFSTAHIRFEVRKNPEYFIAETPMQDEEGNNSFGVLAKYIGVFGVPQNEGAQPMAMTSPVIFEKAPVKIAMTSPAITDKKFMSFVLPFSFQSLNEIPVPKDSRISIRHIPSKTIAAVKFSGWYSDRVGKEYFDRLLQGLKENALVEADAKEDDVKWSVAQYHPPFTIPFFRRNEVWVELKDDVVKGDA